jgi:hypothetical protein
MEGLILLSVLLAQGVSGPVGGSLQVDASIAFEHNTSAKSFSELRVHASSITGGTLVLETTGASPNVRLEIELLPGEAKEFRVPIRVEFSGQPLALTARLDGGDARSILLDVVQRSGPRFVVVGESASKLLLVLPSTELLNTSSLPHIAEAYRQIDALALDSQAVTALEADQLWALLEYVGTCGRLLLINVSDAVADIFTQRAACGGQFLKVIGEPENSASEFMLLIEQADILLPTDQQMIRLVKGSDDESFDWARLIIIWLTYLILIAALLIRAGPWYTALSFSVISTTLVVSMWPAAASSTFVAWAEMTSNENKARYLGLERHSSARHGHVTLPGDEFGGHSRQFSDAEFMLLVDGRTDQRHILWNAIPFEQLDHLTIGSFPVDTTLQFQDSEVSATVCNIGSNATEPMYLQWNRSLYELASIKAGERWSTTDNESLNFASAHRPELQLFLERSDGHSLTLLQVLPVPSARNDERAWLLQYQSHQNEGSQCEG